MYCTVYMWGKWTYKRIDIVHTCFHTSNNKKMPTWTKSSSETWEQFTSFYVFQLDRLGFYVWEIQIIFGTENRYLLKKCVTGPPANHWLTKLRGHWRHLITNSKSPKNILLRAVSRKCLNPSICQKRFCKILWNRHYICYLELSLCEPNTYH